jgi:hypothetical protein
MKKTAFTLLFAAVAAVGPGDVSAQTTLKIDTWLAPTNGHNAVVFPTWAKAVEDATQGRVKPGDVLRPVGRRHQRCRVELSRL